MKTIFCWIIANLEGFIAIILFYVMVCAAFQVNPINQDIQISQTALINLLIGSLILAFIFAIITAIFTYRNFDEVISRQFRWRNSNVELFSAQLKYTFSRFFWSMIVYSVYLIILSILILK